MREDDVDPNYPVSAETIGVNFARPARDRGHGRGRAGQAACPQRRRDRRRGSGERGPRRSRHLLGADSRRPAGGGDGPERLRGRASGAGSADDRHQQRRLSSASISADTKEAVVLPVRGAESPGDRGLRSRRDRELPTLLTMANTDRAQAEPARFTARAFVANGTPAYVYRFSYVPAAMREQMAERSAARRRNPLCVRHAGRQGPRAARRRPRTRRSPGWCNTYWANFAKTGDPNGAGPAEMAASTIPARTRSSSSGPMARRSPAPIPGRRGST